jgi:coenzyme F420 biosynthesis associated uncharacterized protein
VTDLGIVDWRLAERMGVALAREPGEPNGAAGAFGPDRIESACAEAAAHVTAYTGLGHAASVPRGEAVGRSEWVRSALRSLREISGGLERRLEAGLQLPGPLGTVARSMAGAAAGAEAGGAVGLAGRRVLGQFDFSLSSSRPPRLLFVSPNLVAAQREIGADPGAFLDWIAMHEVTHAIQFQAAPWLRDHLRSELDGLIDSAAEGLSGRDLASLARKLVTTDPRRTLRGLLRGELAAALAGPAQRERLDRLQAAMSTVEGYAEHVMDLADPARTGERRRLRAKIDERRRSRGGLGEAIARLLGLELKLRQYRLGKAFCDAVVAEADIGTLNRVWDGPASLPTPAELTNPAAWVHRAAAVAA